MIIICPDGYEFELTWAGRVDTWHMRLHKVLNKPTVCNGSAIQMIAQMHAQVPEKRISRHKQNPRCARDYPWQCPYGSAYPCISKRKSDNKELATIELSNWERKKGFKPDGNQLTLFRQGYWENVKTGEQRWTNEPRPFTSGDVVCKQFAVASMEWLKRKQDWKALSWRILPVDEDMNWVNNQQIMHSGKYEQCIFDIWD